MFLRPRAVYLDHNATTPVAEEVRGAMLMVLKKIWGNPSSAHTYGRAARRFVENARESVSGLIGCNPEQIFFTSGGTEGNNAVIKGVFAGAGGKGHIITSKIEHDSILGACSQAEAMGGDVTYLAAGRDGLVRPEDVSAAIRSDTILISIMHANNETGAIQPVKEIGRIAREAGIPLHTDAVQSCGKVRTDVDELGCEFLTLTAHKINGPKGAGAIYWRGNTKWEPLIFGGSQERRYRAGTEGPHQAAGLGAAARLAKGRMDSEFQRMKVLREHFISGLTRLFPELKINEATEGSQLPGTINVTFPGIENVRMLAGLDCYNIFVSTGSACTADRTQASHVLTGMGLSEKEALSSLRISMGTTTTKKDLDYTLKVFKKIPKKIPAGFAYMDPKNLTMDRILSGETFLIDLRPPHYRLLSPTVPGAREWSHLYFERYFKQIPWDKEVVLMCVNGGLAFSAGYRLAKAGHKAVRVLQGGYNAWNSIHPGLLEQLNEKSSEILTSSQKGTFHSSIESALKRG